jgi:hypothetical protein
LTVVKSGDTASSFIEHAAAMKPWHINRTNNQYELSRILDPSVHTVHRKFNYFITIKQNVCNGSKADILGLRAKGPLSGGKPTSNVR